MFRLSDYILKNYKKSLVIPMRNFIKSNSMEIKEEVRFALANNRPVVALESTIITHGMPFPDNVQCALEVENIIREKGVIPATISIINGAIKVGTSSEEITMLGETIYSKPIKTSRRDLSFVLSNNHNGGTTVSGTILIAAMAGISIFATGGIGGVHRCAEQTFDISADLTELGRNNVAVVSSGIKSILDIPKTLEYLETQGVFVATFGDTKDFPAFYSRISGSKVPYSISSAEEAANIIKTSRDYEINSGILFAVPIPEKYSIPSEKINEAISMALQNMGEEIKGKEVTPYLLAQIANITKGKSLESNVALIKNNAKVAAEIAVALSNLESSFSPKKDNNGENSPKRGIPLIIGGSNLDCNATLDTTEIKMDGRIYDSNFSYAAGGVGRNICESLYKLGCPTNFVTVVGDDNQGKLIRKSIPMSCSDLVTTDNAYQTAQCMIVLDKIGECKFLMGDMKIHSRITSEMIKNNENIIKSSPLVILDANLSEETLGESLRLAYKYNVPVFFEPTDLDISIKPFKTPYWRAIKIITPNLNELRHIASYLQITTNKTFIDTIDEAAQIAKDLLKCLDNIIVTLGSKGILIARRGSASEKFFEHKETSQESVRYYPTTEIKKLVNVSGAGDSFASGFIAALIAGCPEETCVSVGFAAANVTLQSDSAVPKYFFDRHHSSWRTGSPYKNIF